MTQIREPELEIDDPDFHLGDPLPVYARLREQTPVYWCESARCWAILKYEDIRYISAHPQQFSSAHGLQPGDNLYPERDEIQTSGAESIIRADPPRHAQLRRMVSRAFTPRYVAHLESHILKLASDGMQVFADGGPADFVEHVAEPVSMYLIADLLAVPRSDRPMFRKWSDVMISTGDATTAEQLRNILESNLEMIGYFTDMLHERQKHPGDDLISLLIAAEVDGEHLSPENVVMMARTLLAAGNETTRNLMSHTIYNLYKNPGQRAVLINDPSLVGKATDEFVRWATPVRTMARTATAEVEIRGQRIAAGDYVVMLYPSANRDEDAWPDADVFDVTRKHDPMHVAFGFGEHMCLGANLARLEAATVLREFLRRYPDYHVVQEPERLRSVEINGINKLEVAAS